MRVLTSALLLALVVVCAVSAVDARSRSLQRIVDRFGRLDGAMMLEKGGSVKGKDVHHHFHPSDSYGHHDHLHHELLHAHPHYHVHAHPFPQVGGGAGSPAHVNPVADATNDLERRRTLYRINARDDVIHDLHHRFIEAQNMLEHESMAFQSWLSDAEQHAQRELGAHKNAITAIKNKLDELNKQQDADRSKLSTLATQIDKSLYQARLQASNAELARQQKFEASLQARLKAAQEQSSKLQSEIADINSHISADGSAAAPAADAAPAASFLDTFLGDDFSEDLQ